MENKKILIASGCSFTFESWNWPTFVANEMDYDLLNVAMASIGNGLISKKIIYNVEKLLKYKSSKDIIVGIMWSGIDRYEFYTNNSKKTPNIDGWVENPTNIVDDEKNWLIVNHHWQTFHSKNWYSNFHTDIGASIETIKDILLTQWYLERNRVKYFMSTYLDIFNKQFTQEIIENPDVQYLYKMIDFTKFLPINGCYEWVEENHEEYGINKPDLNGFIDTHPTKFGHEKFSQEVVIPFIKNNLLIDE
jgi:hypothetical protein